jgi:hypothetical protein
MLVLIWEGYGVWFGSQELTSYSDMSRSAVRAREREAIRRAETQRAVLDQIPKASIMSGERRCFVLTGSIVTPPSPISQSGVGLTHRIGGGPTIGHGSL